MKTLLSKLKSTAELEHLSLLEYHCFLNNHLSDRVREDVTEKKSSTYEELLSHINDRVL